MVSQPTGEQLLRMAALQAQVARLTAALRPFAYYHQERQRLHPNVTRTDSTIPVLTYGECRLGDRHFRAADAALSGTGGGKANDLCICGHERFAHQINKGDCYSWNCDCRGFYQSRRQTNTGEGWLPPEVREQVREALDGLARNYHEKERHQGPFINCNHFLCTKARAALAALEEK